MPTLENGIICVIFLHFNLLGTSFLITKKIQSKALKPNQRPFLKFETLAFA